MYLKRMLMLVAPIMDLPSSPHPVGYGVRAAQAGERFAQHGVAQVRVTRLIPQSRAGRAFGTPLPPRCGVRATPSALAFLGEENVGIGKGPRRSLGFAFATVLPAGAREHGSYVASLHLA